jgi:hypothetical protein
MATKRLTIAQRKDIFRALVALQDQGLSARQSAEQARQSFAITEAQLRSIEEEGIDKEWPPLDEAETHVA